MRRLPLGDDVTSGAPIPLPLPESLRRAVDRPLRIRIRAPDRHCCIEWEVLEALVRMARQSDLAVEVECITAEGASLLLSLV